MAPAEQAWLATFLAQLLATPGQRYSCELVMHRADEQPFYAQLEGVASILRPTRPATYRLILLDVSEHHRAAGPFPGRLRAQRGEHGPAGRPTLHGGQQRPAAGLPPGRVLVRAAARRRLHPARRLRSPGLRAGPLPPRAPKATLSTATYRIVQELLNNVMKHAQAHEVFVSVVREAYQLHISVEDDGVGFDPGSSEGGQGIGLVGIRTRAELLGGSFEVKSRPGRGTGFFAAPGAEQGAPRRVRQPLAAPTGPPSAAGRAAAGPGCRHPARRLASAGHPRGSETTATRRAAARRGCW